MEETTLLMNIMWTMLGAFLVYFMQAGFAMVETGFTRAKNAGNICMKNMMDFVLGSLFFFILGFPLMFGKNIAGIIGGSGFLNPYSLADANGMINGLPIGVFMIFHTVFCATAATIVSGAMAERTKFSSYLVYSAAISIFIYPVTGHWIWGGGWLAEIGFHDFAGSTAVHMVGGVCAFVGAKIVGPRLGKYNSDGTPNAIPGHNIPLGFLGVFILWFCWFGFNGCSTVSMDSDASVYSAGTIFVTTNLAAATATVATMIITWLRYKKPDISMTLNGSLAGLVAITAGCDLVTPAGAFFIGLIAAFVVVSGIEFIDKVCRIDDPVGAIGVHGMCGAAGTLLTGVFAADGGLAYGGGFHFLGVQLIGVAAVIVWVAVTMTFTFTVLKKTIGLRASWEEETKGLDATEHNLSSSYADFMPMVFMGKTTEEGKGDVSVEKAITVEHFPDSEPVPAKTKLTKIVMVFNQTRFISLKDALSELGVTGMTVTQVMGCGTQKGHMNYYRGVQVEEVALLPKIKLEVVVSKVPVDQVVETAKKALYTGNIGDGKIFVYDVRCGRESRDLMRSRANSE